MTAARSRRPVRAKSARGDADARKLSGCVTIDEEQRWHLVEDCAFFRAARYRDVVPGQIREADVRAVEAEIDAVLAPRPARPQKRRP